MISSRESEMPSDVQVAKSCNTLPVSAIIKRNSGKKLNKRWSIKRLPFLKFNRFTASRTGTCAPIYEWDTWVAPSSGQVSRWSSSTLTILPSTCGTQGFHNEKSLGCARFVQFSLRKLGKQESHVLMHLLWLRKLKSNTIIVKISCRVSFNVK